MAKHPFSQKRLVRRQRAQALERSRQQLRGLISHAAFVMGGAVAVTMALQLFVDEPKDYARIGIFPALLRHFGSVVGPAVAAYFAALFTFRFLAPFSVLAPLQLVFLGAAFALTAELSFLPAVQFSGAFGAALWLFVLATGITYAGALLFSEPRR